VLLFEASSLEVGSCTVANGRSPFATAPKPEQLNDLVSQYPDAKAVRLDITNKTAVKAAVDAALEAFGRIDVLVNNAGYGLIGALEKVSDKQIWRNFDTNLFGAINMIRAVLPIMR
jgi:NADP-dependent 3-hydroxy acid dehydrogenase YdfG